MAETFFVNREFMCEKKLKSAWKRRIGKPDKSLSADSSVP